MPLEKLTIEKDVEGYWLCGHGTYDEDSVFDGQPRFVLLAHGETPGELEERALTLAPGVQIVAMLLAGGLPLVVDLTVWWLWG